jgi:hypothetical protein
MEKVLRNLTSQFEETRVLAGIKSEDLQCTLEAHELKHDRKHGKECTTA